MSTCKRICVTNRKLVSGDFLEQITKAIESGCDAIILREKDLEEKAYEQLAGSVLAISKKHFIPCMLHTYTEVADRLGSDALHLPYEAFLQLQVEQRRHFSILGVSVHSVEEAIAAYQAGATYLTAGHIFATDCKKNVPPRGLDFLRSVCEAVPIPVYAIGGIQPDHATECMQVGAAGVCMMSYYMYC